MSDKPALADETGQEHVEFKVPGKPILLQDVEPGMFFYMQEGNPKGEQTLLEEHDGPLMMTGRGDHKCVTAMNDPVCIWPHDFINCWNSVVVLAYGNVQIGERVR